MEDNLGEILFVVAVVIITAAIPFSVWLWKKSERRKKQR